MLRKELNLKGQDSNVLKRFSGMLALALVFGAFASLPSANAIEAKEVIPTSLIVATEDMNTITYSIKSKTKLIGVDLADSHALEVAFIAVKMPVTVNGKKVLKYFAVDTVLLDDFGRANTKTLINIKAGNMIRVSVLGNPKDLPIVYKTVK
jgi:hypothetical protein